MRLGVVAESHSLERRIAVAPETVSKLLALGFDVEVERGAGLAAGFDDADYQEAGAAVVSALGSEGYREAEGGGAWTADVVLKVRPPTAEEAARLVPGSTLISLISPADNEERLTYLAERGVTVLALDKIPRTSRAQAMDVLSSMANLAGYRAVLEAATLYQGLFSPQVTAAGTRPPARVLVIGAGVAGLAAIAAARGLGAEVRAFDTRLAAREQVESLGARFLEVDFDESGEGGGGYGKVMSEAFIEAEMALFRAQAAEVDIIVTTALIPGRPAPLLVPEDVVDCLKPGSVVVDLAAERGGNCALTEADQVVVHNGVHIVGYTDLVSRMAATASQLFGANIANLLGVLGGAEAFEVDLEDEILRGAFVVHDGERLPPPERPPPPAKPPEPERISVIEEPARPQSKPSGPWSTVLASGIVLVLVFALGRLAPEGTLPAPFLQHLTVFVLACFVGWQVVWSVSPALHTPLMSVTNAISGIIIVGGMLQVRSAELDLASILGVVAVVVAAVNISGGFLVTQRMLAMFRREPDS